MAAFFQLETDTSAMTIPSGVRVGPYEIRSLLGAGGMGEFYRAYDANLNREVALKITRRASDPLRGRLAESWLFQF